MELSKYLQLTNFMQVAVFLGPGIDTYGGPNSVSKDKKLYYKMAWNGDEFIHCDPLEKDK